MNLFQIAIRVSSGLSQPISDRRDYGSSPDQMDRANEWKNTDEGSELLNTTYHIQELAEGIKSNDDLGELISLLNSISEKSKSVLNFIE